MSEGSTNKPCKRCPFRSDIEPYIRYNRARKIADSLYMGNSFPCHQTTTHDDGEYVPTSGEKMCAGAAITLLKYDGPNNYMRIMSRIGAMDLNRLEREGEATPLYECLEEWVAAHEEVE